MADEDDTISGRRRSPSSLSVGAVESPRACGSCGAAAQGDRPQAFLLQGGWGRLTHHPGQVSARTVICPEPKTKDCLGSRDRRQHGATQSRSGLIKPLPPRCHQSGQPKRLCCWTASDNPLVEQLIGHVDARVRRRAASSRSSESMVSRSPTAPKRRGSAGARTPPSMPSYDIGVSRDGRCRRSVPRARLGRGDAPDSGEAPLFDSHHKRQLDRLFVYHRQQVFLEKPGVNECQLRRSCGRGYGVKVSALAGGIKLRADAEVQSPSSWRREHELEKPFRPCFPTGLHKQICPFRRHSAAQRNTDGSFS